MKKTLCISRTVRRELTGFLFSLPLIIGLIWLFLYPLMNSLIMSFCKVTFESVGGYSLKFTGMSNYVYALFTDPTFNRRLVDSMLNMLWNVPVIVMFSFFAATLINEKFKGQRLAKFIFFLPLVISSAAIMSLDATDYYQNVMSNSSYKALDVSGSFLQGFKMQELLSLVGLPQSVMDFIVGAVNSVYKTISMSGVQIVILLAALQSVPRSLYEAAIVDGATGWEQFWKITFHMISPMLLLCTIYSIIDSFTSSSNVVLSTIKTEMFNRMDMGLSSAMSWLYFIIVIVFIGAVYLICSRGVFYYDK